MAKLQKKKEKSAVEPGAKKYVDNSVQKPWMIHKFPTDTKNRFMGMAKVRGLGTVEAMMEATNDWITKQRKLIAAGQ